MRDALVESASCVAERSPPCPSSPSSPPAKGSCATSILDQLMGDDEDDDDEDDDDEAKSSVVAEVDVYLAEKVAKRNINPLELWEMNASRFPRLAQQARKYLCIPGACVPSELVFSFAGYIVNKKRCSMSSKMIDAVIFLHVNQGVVYKPFTTP